MRMARRCRSRTTTSPCRPRASRSRRRRLMPRRRTARSRASPPRAVKTRPLGRTSLHYTARRILSGSLRRCVRVWCACRTWRRCRLRRGSGCLRPLRFPASTTLLHPLLLHRRHHPLLQRLQPHRLRHHPLLHRLHPQPRHLDPYPLHHPRQHPPHPPLLLLLELSLPRGPSPWPMAAAAPAPRASSSVPVGAQHQHRAMATAARRKVRRPPRGRAPPPKAPCMPPPPLPVLRL